MGKIRVGNKENAGLNGEFAGHIRRWFKRLTAKYRRNNGKQDIKNQLKDDE